MSVVLRHAQASDVPLILQLIKELAIYEKEDPAKVVQTTEEMLMQTLGFAPGSTAYARTLLAFTSDGAPAGMALYFNTFSTWRGRPGVWLEDLFVRDEFRGRGYGKALLAALAREVQRISGARLEWTVLKWNVKSIGFYESIGAVNMGKEWQVMRVDGEALESLAKSGPEAKEE